MGEAIGDQQGGQPTQRGREKEKEKDIMKTWQEAKWQTAWERSSQGKDSPVWTTPWNLYMPRVHAALRRPESTMATLLCMEAIGFNDFLYRVGVPDIGPQCPCRWERQTPKHVVMFCPCIQGHDHMLAVASTMDYGTLLSTAKGLRAVAPWLIQAGVLAQFTVAKEIGEEDRDSWRPLPVLAATNILP